MQLQSKSKPPASFLWVASMIVLMGFGCTGNGQRLAEKEESYLARRRLESVMKENRDQQGRAAKALAKLDDPAADSVPMPVSAGLGCRDTGEVILLVSCLDKGRDLRGVHVVEKRTDPNGATATLDQWYPIWLAWPETTVLMSHRVPVEMGDLGHKRNEDAWKDYEIRVLDALVHEFVYKERVRGVVKLPPDKAAASKMPPVLVPFPDPGRVCVGVSFYDNAGNESDGIDLDISPYCRRVLKERVGRNGAQR